MLGTPHTSDFYFVRSFSCIEKNPNTLETVQGRITTCSADKWGSSSGGSTPASRSATRAPRRHETSRLGRHEDRCSLSLPCPGRMRTDKASSASTCMAEVAHPDILLLMLLWHARSVHHPDADAHLRPTEGHPRPRPTLPPAHEGGARVSESRGASAHTPPPMHPLCPPYAPPMPPPIQDLVQDTCYVWGEHGCAGGTACV